MQTATNILVALVQIKLILATLPPTQAGAWFLFASLGGYITFFDLGISPTLSREIAFDIGKSGDPRQDVATLVRTAKAIFAVLALAVLFLGAGAGSVYLRAVTPTPALHAVLLGWVIYAVGAAANLYGGANFAALYGLGAISVERWIRSAVAVAGLVAVLLALNAGFGLIGLCSVWLAQGVILYLAGRIALQRRFPWLKETPVQPDLNRAKRLALPSAKWALTSLGAILILNTDNVVIAAILGPGRIADYAVIAKVANVAITLAVYVATASTPFVSRAYAAGDLDAVRLLVQRNVRFSLGLMITLAAVLATFGDRLIGLWVGPAHFAGFAVLIPFLVMLTLETHHVVLATVVMATGHIVFYKVALIAAPVSILLAIVLGHRYGLPGVAASTMIAQLLTNNWYVPWYSLRTLNIPARPYLTQIIAPAVALTLFALATGLALRHLTPSTPIFTLAASSATGLAATALAFALLTRPQERTRLRQAITQRFGRTS